MAARRVLVAILVTLAAAAEGRVLLQTYGPLAQEVVERCPRFSYYGENFLQGVNLVNSSLTASVGDCCTACDSLDACNRWVWCLANQTDGCVAPVGPLANLTTFPAGTCLLTNASATNGTGTTWITYSYQQTGVPWSAGIYASSSSGKPPIVEYAQGQEDNTEFMGSQNDTFFCRTVTGGPLKLWPLKDTIPSGPDVEVGQQLKYAGYTLEEGGSGAKWSIVLAGGGPSLYMYPSDQLGYCADTPGCTPNIFSQKTEEGASCGSDDDCCSSLQCKPRGVEEVRFGWASSLSAASGNLSTATLAITPGQPWSLVPNECRQPLAIPAVSPSPPAPPPAPGSGPELLPNGTVRFIGSQSCTQGVAEVAMAGSWGAICSTGAYTRHQQNARVVCRGQGLTSDLGAASITASAAPNGVPVWVLNLQCAGTESSILDCPHKLSADGGPAAGCLRLNISCVDAAYPADAAAGMCTNRPGRCQKLPGSCTAEQGYCSFQAQPAGSPCLGGVCNERGECTPFPS